MEYDYVIAGGGSAGCVLAARLSEDPDVSVLLLEAGPRDWHPYIRIPITVGRFRQVGMLDWGYHSEPEPGLANRRIQLLRGKVLGGGSSVNFMAHNRGNESDYARWVRLGLTDWSYAHMLPYFKRLETWHEGRAPHRGTDGPVGITWTCRTDPLADALLEAARQAGFPSFDDLNGPEPNGFGPAQSAVHRGRRQNAPHAYLRPARGRANLTVRTGVLVTRLRLEGRVAVGVDYVQGGATQTVRARREVIVSAGAFNSPQLLMLSGIGNTDALRKLGIEAVHHLPGVGEGLQDHLSVGLNFRRTGPESPLHRMLRVDRLAVALLQAYFAGKGPATILPSGVNCILRTNEAFDAPDLQILFGAGALEARPWFPGINDFQDLFYLRPVGAHPESRGRVSLAANDPRVAPRIEPRYFSAPGDLETIRRGFRIVREVASQRALDPFRGVELAPGPSVRTDGEIDEYIRHTATTVQHGSCTCRMGTDDMAVVDPQLRVRGLERLRVVDASVMPEVLSCNIHAAVLAIAERAVDMIRGRIAEG